jgi:hypothetical protein
VASADEFFRSPAWDDTIAAEFDVRIRRVPKRSRLGRYSHKAWALFYRSDNDPVRQRAAIQLLERGALEDGADLSEAARDLVVAAGYAVALDDRPTAIALARKSILVSSHHTGGMSAQELLARCLTDEGDPASRSAWNDFYRHREERSKGSLRVPDYNELAARAVVDITGSPVRDPDAAAEGIVVIYHAAEPPEPAVPGIEHADVAALGALDRHYRVLRPNGQRKWSPRAAFKEDYLLDMHLPQLGAYVGRVLVETANGQWQVKAPLMHSRVLVRGKPIDPFRAAYDAIYFEASLADFVRGNR